VEGRFTGWVRLPVQRRPGRRRVRKLRAEVRSRLDSALRPIDGRVLAVGIRRCRAVPPTPLTLPLPHFEPEALQSA
jgi:hypothetical protein